jgi:hypothetical protein
MEGPSGLATRSRKAKKDACLPGLCCAKVYAAVGRVDSLHAACFNNAFRRKHRRMRATVWVGIWRPPRPKQTKAFALRDNAFSEPTSAIGKAFPTKVCDWSRSMTRVASLTSDQKRLRKRRDV